MEDSLTFFVVFDKNSLSVTKMCFFYCNSERTCFRDQNCHKNIFLLLQLLYSGPEICSVKNAFFFGYFICDFQGKVSVRNQIFCYLGYPRYLLCGALATPPPPPLQDSQNRIYSLFDTSFMEHSTTQLLFR